MLHSAIRSEKSRRRSFPYVAPAALVLVFGVMYANDRRRGGYRAWQLDPAVATV
jgi:hypothetical protein